VKVRNLLIALTFIVVAGCNCGAEPADQASPVVAPAWSLQTGTGETIDFPESAGGQPVLLLFWATWCPYCKALMPHIQSVLDEFPDSGLRVFAVSFKDDGDPVAVINKQGFDFTLLVNGELVAKQYGIKSTPGVFLIDGTGHIRFDLRKIQVEQAMKAVSEEDLSHSRKAARKAPYYAAAIRKAVDQLLQSAY